MSNDNDILTTLDNQCMDDRHTAPRAQEEPMTVLPFTTHKFKVWDWVFFAGIRFRIVYPVGGNWKISDGVTSHTVHPSVLTPCLQDADLEREFKDAYPEE